MSAPLRQLAVEAAEAYRPAGRWAYHFARGKLAGDPLFGTLLRPGLLPARGHYLDLGCGQGLLAAWLQAAGRRHALGAWPAGHPPPPRLARYTGVELLDSAVRRGNLALGHDPAIHLDTGDMTRAVIPPVDVVTLIDVLHYIPATAQEALLARIRAQLAADARLLLRVGDASAGLAYRLSRLTDSLVVFGHCARWPALHGRPLDAWLELLIRLGFRCETHPMGGAGFANILILARPD
ncbi:class I SAM-dependent methyltransferase [Zoogloea sp.]|uniref:class I SAM-dependent methyltransferase n=1 Tax=Zoogloea sp. TaxID=49181 RepID=UPI0035B0E380